MSCRCNSILLLLSNMEKYIACLSFFWIQPLPSQRLGLSLHTYFSPYTPFVRYTVFVGVVVPTLHVQVKLSHMICLRSSLVLFLFAYSTKQFFLEQLFGCRIRCIKNKNKKLNKYGNWFSFEDSFKVNETYLLCEWHENHAR